MASYRCRWTKEITFDIIEGFKMGKREVSIILPTYNEEKNIGRLISILNDELKGENFEIIIVDDDSKDNRQRSWREGNSCA